jgi:hypothetical protein
MLPPTEVLSSEVVAAARRVAAEAPPLPCAAGEMLRRLHCPAGLSLARGTVADDPIAA